VSGGIDEVQFIFDTVGGWIGDCDRLTFNGDAPFPLNIHIVEDLVLELAVINYLCLLDEPVGEG
jgi:hypothetical protein